MTYLFTILFYQPILNLLVFLYNVVPGNDIGIVVILLTIIIKLLLLPLSKKSIESQKSLQDLQPKVEEIKKKYANNKEEMGRAMMQLYKDNKVNPFSSCLPLLIQLPFLIAVFKVFAVGFSNGSLDLVYPFIDRPEMINPIAFGFLDLAKANVYLALMAGAAQFWQAKMMISKKAPIKDAGAKDENMMAAMNKQMLYFLPAITVIFGLSLPGGLTFYWFLTTILTAFQQKFIFKKDTDKDQVQEKQQLSDSSESKVIEGEVIEKK